VAHRDRTAPPGGCTAPPGTAQRLWGLLGGGGYREARRLGGVG
jgi:hypothetical protein